MPDTNNKAEQIIDAIESILGGTLDEYQVRDICDTLEIEYPQAIQDKIDFNDNVSLVKDDIKRAQSVGMDIEQWYETLIADFKKDFGHDSNYFPQALAFYRENKEQFA